MLLTINQIMNFREKAASLVLSNDNIAEALDLLDNANDTIPSEVIVWEKFEYDPIESIIDYIDTIESMLKAAYQEGLKNN
jgi:hemerythrin-like domain-containing protein